MRTTILALAGSFILAGILAGGAFAQTTGTTDTSCGKPPCATAAPGGTSGSGPAAVRNAPVDSPVGTGSGSSGGKASGK